MNGPSCDVLIVGGGPAGTTAATFLARRGYHVVLLEKESFPREHVGESLLPFCYGLFDQLGVLPEMERRFVRKPGVRFIDRDGVLYTNWCFAHVLKDDPSHLSFQVIRSEFDQILLDNARRNGVEVHERTRVTGADLESKGGLVRVQAKGETDACQIETRFLVDASGRDTFLGTRMGCREKNPELDRTALWSHWTDAELCEGLDEGMSLIIYMGEEKRGWIWTFPLGRNRVTVGVVLENSYIRRQQTELHTSSEDWKVDLYRREIFLSGVLRRVLGGARMSRPLFVNGDYSYSVSRKFGDRFALVGDAHRFIDPIFSSGIFLSMKSAQLVSDAIDNVLRNPDRGLAPLEATYNTINGAYGFVHRLICMFYNPHAINWAEMGSAEAVIHKRHESAMAAGHYVLAGDFFEQHEKYTEFFALLENPRHFEKYKKMIIDRQTYWVPSCEPDLDVVFNPALEEHETSRAEEDSRH